MSRSPDTLAALFRSASRNALLLAMLPLGFLLVVPLPTPLLSLLLVADLLLSAVVLGTLLRARSTAEMSTLPTLLLLGALYRLALNLASSRLILTQGDAGEVIEAAGRLLTESHWAVGLLLYAIVSLIQWVVINAGSSRVAEVAARFALDALPVRMLALDADLKAGRMQADEGVRRRAELLAEANWQGAMDGAVRFVRGDATVGIIIAAVNLVAGTMLGVLRDGLPLPEAADTYATLAIGDGLVSQIPSLLLSVGAALVVTRSGVVAGGDGLSGRLIAEFLGAPRHIAFAGVWVAAFGLLPGLPMLPFAAVGLPVAAVAFWRARAERVGRSGRVARADLVLPPDALARWESAQEQVRTFERRLRLRWGFNAPPLRIVPGSAVEPRVVVIWEGSRVAAWRPPGANGEAFVAELAAGFGPVVARTLRSTDVAQRVEETGRALPSGVALSDATEAIRNCLREGLAVASIERVVDHWESAPHEVRSSSAALAERAREVLAAPELLRLAPDGRVAVVLVTPSIEQELRGVLRLGSANADGEPPPAIREIVARALAAVPLDGADCIVVSQEVRRLLAPIVAEQFGNFPLFGHREVQYAGVELRVVARLFAGAV